MLKTVVTETVKQSLTEMGIKQKDTNKLVTNASKPNMQCGNCHYSSSECSSDQSDTESVPAHPELAQKGAQMIEDMSKCLLSQEKSHGKFGTTI